MTEEVQTTETETPVVETPVIETPVAEQGDALEQADEGENQPDETDLQRDKRRGKTAQDRFDQLTREKHELRRELEAVKRLVTASTQHSPVEGAPEPTADQFDTYDQYVRAVTKWEIAQTLAEQSSTRAQQTTDMVRAANWDARLVEARAAIPDFAEVVGSSEVVLAKHVEDAMLDSDLGPQLAYHMAQHPELVDRLNGLSPAKAALEMGRLEVSLAAPVVKPMTKAPAPATPIRGGPTTKVPLATADMETFIAERRKQGARY